LAAPQSVSAALAAVAARNCLFCRLWRRDENTFSVFIKETHDTFIALFSASSRFIF